MPWVTYDLPLHQATGVRQLPHISGLKLADGRYQIWQTRQDWHPHWWKAPMKNDIATTPHGENPDIVAFNIVLGWAIMDAYPVETSPPSSTTARVSHAVSLPSTDDLLSKFWETEEISAAPWHSPKEWSPLEHFDSTHTLLPEGRFHVQFT